MKLLMKIINNVPQYAKKQNENLLSQNDKAVLGKL